MFQQLMPYGIIIKIDMRKALIYLTNNFFTNYYHLPESKYPF